MPIYAYRCQSCDACVDVLQKMSDAPLLVCQACGQPSLVKQITAAGFQLKGSGWYVTDFRGGDGAAKSGTPSSSTSAAAPAAAPAASSTSGTSENK